MPRESKRKKQERAIQVIQTLQDFYGEVVCTLDARFDPWQLLVAAILAAQCTDARVNKVTPKLFERFPKPIDFANASPEIIEPYIASCGLFRNKAKNIHRAAEQLESLYGGEVPSSMEDLLALHGVGRKIANLIRGDYFGYPGIVVDTHCMRISCLLGFSKAKSAPAVEKDLNDIVPEEYWIKWGHYMVEHGRACCIARRPQCQVCPISELCPSSMATT